jgi:Sulfatase
MDERPNIVFFYWDNFGWGELGCYGGGVLRGASTPRIDGLAAEGLKRRRKRTVNSETGTTSQNYITASSMRVAEDEDRRFLHDRWD